MLQNPMARKAIYALVVCAGVVAVAFGVLDQGQADQWVAIVLGVVGMVGGGTAIGNVTPRPATVPVDAVAAMIGDAMGRVGDAAAALPGVVLSRAEQVDQARRELERRMGGGR